ncbi:MAG TPA: hypothetical protein VGF15_03295 [Solirubrobacteraceae bacterium]
MLDPAPDLSTRAAGASIALRSGPEGLRYPSAHALAREHPKLLGFVARAALLGLVALGVVLVALTAAHPSFMTPTANPRYFPAWMAGPLRGLWPQHSLSDHATHTLITAILSVMYLAYLTVLGLSRRLGLRWVLGAILALHLVFLLAPPLQYTDVFNYINYARMGVVHHLNPYTTVPMLEPQSDPAFALSNWHWLLSPYGPIFTLFTYALVPLGVSGAFWTLKLVLCFASLAVLAVVWRSALILGRDPVRALLLVGLNPIVLVWGLGADHNDILMVLPLTLGVHLLIRARAAGAPGLRLGVLRARAAQECLAAGSLVVAGAVKISAAVAIPIAFVAAQRRRAFLTGFVAAVGALGLISLLAFGAHVPGVGTQTQLVTDVGPANLLGWLLGQGGETDTLRTVLTVLAGGFVCSAAVLSSRPGRDWIALAGASLFVVWVSTSWFAPWYVVWILPFAALAERRRLMLWVLAFGVYILLAFGPEVTPLLQSLHLHPFGSRIGQEHYRLTSHLVQ